MHGIGEVVELVVSWAVTTAWAFAIVIGDEKDLDEEELARAWPPSTRAVAIVGISWLVLPIHFARTRGEWWPPRLLAGRLLGLLLGLGCTAGALVECSVVIDLLTSFITPLVGR